MSRSSLPSAAAVLLLALPAAAEIQIGAMEPLSGPFANVGEQGIAHFRLAAERINAAGGVLGQKLEIVPLDNKSSPQESLIALQSAVDQGIRIITQGRGSNVALALVDALDKHNARNPDRSVLYVNYSAVDPDLTNDKCSFWHFRFDANTDQKLEAITDHIAAQKDVKRVYLIGQDYSHGHQVARISQELLKRKRPDIAFVGNDLHPIGKVKDFAPYVAKIAAARPDVVITGNWGNDLALLIRAAKEGGLKAKIYTYYGGGLGTPTAMGEAGAGHVLQVTEWHPNVESSTAEAFANAYNRRFTGHEYYYLRTKTALDMLAKAIEQAGSLEPKKIALALEGMRFRSDVGEVWMRKQDHQIILPLFISIFEKVGAPGVKYQSEKTGYGFKTVAAIPAKDTEVPTTCRMQRP
jgi:branched-chain amino acid transport system substrate-binding protein